jgi:hypothetical protein
MARQGRECRKVKPSKEKKDKGSHPQSNPLTFLCPFDNLYFPPHAQYKYPSPPPLSLSLLTSYLIYFLNIS